MLLLHFRVVLNRLAHVAEDAQNSCFQLNQLFGIGLPVNFDVHDRLGSAAFAGFAGQNFTQATFRVPLRLHDRLNHQMQSQSLAVDLHGHRVHQERHVVIDDLDDRVRGLPSVFLALRIVNAQLGSAGSETPS